MIDTKGMKVVKEGVIDNDFRNWMDTNFGNWEDGNILIEVERKRICCYNVDKKVIFIMNGFDFHPFSCKAWKLLFDGKSHFLVFSYVIYDDDFSFDEVGYHTEQIFKIIGTSNNFNEKV